MTRYVFEFEAAFWDGNLLGDPDGSGKVTPHTCPRWFPAVCRDVQAVSLSFKDLADGEVVNHQDAICWREGNTMYAVGPGMWIVKVGQSLRPFNPPTPISMKRKP